MTDTDNSPIPTLEETQAALASLDPRTACILRRRLGLAAAEPEPSVPTREREPPKAEPTAAPLLNLDPAAHAIDLDARQRLDAEVEEKARAEAEPDAAAAAVAKGTGTRAAPRAAEPEPALAAALAPLKARARRLSPVKRRLEESAVRVLRELPPEVIYQHSVFCQTVLPYRDPGPEVRKWERQQGQANLLLEAGHIRGPEGRYLQVGLPYGPAARLILANLNTTALQTRNRLVDIEGSMTAYIRRLTGHQTRGADIHRFKEQLIRLSGCIVRIGYDLGEYAVQVNSHIVGALDLCWTLDKPNPFRFEKAVIPDEPERISEHLKPPF